MAYSFQAKIGARGYHVYKNLPWSHAKKGDFVTGETVKKIDPYCCAIKAMVDIPTRLKTGDMVKHELRVTSYKLRVTSYELKA